MPDLHQKYAPILRFNKDEQFFPMRVDDMLTYSGLYAKDQAQPIVPPGRLTVDRLTRAGRSPEVFVRTVESGPLLGADVVSEWGEGALEMVLRWAAETTTGWTEEMARRAYSWFSPKTSAATQLFWWNGLLSSFLKEGLQTASPDKLPRLLLPAETHASAAERYTSAKPGYTYYHRQVRDGNFLSLQYWFFYSYNDWGSGFGGLNDHEGDWESMHLFFRLDPQGRPQEPPAYITYANHESRLTKPWGHPDITLVGAHPVGYVAAGSHATYPQQTAYDLMKLYGLVDYATGDGPTIDHDQWAHRINLDDAPWLGDYAGSWGTRFWLSTSRAKTLLQVALGATPLSGLIGLTSTPREIELPGVSAPRGPVGKQRPQYANPVKWAGINE